MDPNALTAKDMSIMFGVSERQVNNYIADDKFPQPDTIQAAPGAGRFKNTYKMQEVVAWYINKQIEKYKEKLDATPQNQAEAQLKKTTEEGRLKELDRMEREGTLVEVEDVERTWLQALGRFRDTLLRSGQSFAQDVTALPEITFNSVKEIYLKNASDALEEMSNQSAIVEDIIDDIEMKIE